MIPPGVELASIRPRTRKLGRQRDEAHRPSGEEPLEKGGVGVVTCICGMSAETGRREERPLEVHPEDPRAARRARDGSESGDERRLRGRDQRGQDAVTPVSRRASPAAA